MKGSGGDGPDHSFDLGFRVECELERLGLHETSLASQWRECLVRWGSLSSAALGVLEHGLLPVALKDPHAYLKWNGSQWEVALGRGDGALSVFGRADTKGEALAAALAQSGVPAF